jgi:hypothetical protein
LGLLLIHDGDPDTVGSDRIPRAARRPIFASTELQLKPLSAVG